MSSKKTTHKKNTHHSSCNPKDHINWNRRSFLQALGLVGGGTMMLGNTNLTVSKPSPLSVALSEAESENILIICRLGGGNDGFNTIIPVFDYDIYANARPLIKIPPSEFINLEKDQFAMPKPMNKLESMWGNGQMKVVHGVGYEDQSLSHFKGTDIWANTDLTNEELSGFMGRYFQDLYPSYLLNPPASPPSIQIGSIGNLIFRGPDNDFSFAISSPERLENILENETFYDIENLPECTYGDKLKFVRETANVTYNYADEIVEAYNRSVDFGGYLENDGFARQLRIVARLIKGNLGTKVYMVTMGGFDTHNNQINRHQELLNSFSEGITNFYADLAAAGWDDKVLTMTISEFGRRFKENGSLGTDHGTAAPIMFFGTGLNGNGFVGEHPSLSNLTRGGNIFPSNDFRQVYATVMKEWLCVNPDMVNNALLGADFESLDLGFSCDGSTSSIPLDGDRLNHVVTYVDNQTYININNPETTHVDVSLFNILGQKVATLRNEMMLEGQHVINVKEDARMRLDTGQYLYLIETNKGEFSKPLMIS